MKIAKRILLFASVNILIVVSLSIVLHLLGVGNYVNAKGGIEFQTLIVFCAVYGFGAAFISLALSRVMAKWMMGVKVIDDTNTDPRLQSLVSLVHGISKRAGLQVMPQVGWYESPELNAFATGPTKNRSLVAVSSGLLDSLNPVELEGVIAHEVAHISNGDMVSMTLVQGVVNAFVMFAARLVGFFASQFVDEDKRPMVQFAIVIVAEIGLGFLGMIVVAKFSRAREFRADDGGAALSSHSSMIAALMALKRQAEIPAEERPTQQPALASLKISGQPSRLFALFSTHPPLDARIEALTRACGTPN